MGGCCSGNSNNAEQEGHETNRPQRPNVIPSYDSDDSSQDGLLPEDGVAGSGGGRGSEEEEEVPKKMSELKPEPRSLPKLKKTVSMRTQTINKNVVDGWKNAVGSGNDSLVIHLFEEYKDHNVIDIVFDNGDNSLHVACQHKKVELAYFLLKKGIEVNSVNTKNGNSALHYACEQRDEKLVKLLLKNQADPMIVNKKGKRPFDIARRYRSVKIQQLLKAAQEEHALAGAFGDKAATLGLDDVDSFAQDRQRGRPNVQRITELGGKKIGVHQSSLLDEFEDSTGIDDSESSRASRRTGGFRSRADSGLSERERGQTDTELQSDIDELEDLIDMVPLTKEEKENEQTQLELHRIKQRNPFVRRKLERRRTKKILESGGTAEREKSPAAPGADNAILAAKKARLPELEGWLEKRKQHPPYQWQKRWVVVKDTHMLWSDKKKSIEDPSKAEQRKEFNGFLNINVLQAVAKYESKSSNKFTIKARDAKRHQSREYLWKCPSMEDRNYWVKGLKQYMKYHEEAYKFGA